MRKKELEKALEILIDKEIKLSLICEKLDVSEEEVFGLLRVLELKGQNIMRIVKGNDFYILNKGHKKLEVDNSYTIVVDDKAKDISMGVLADTRLGSNYQQLSNLKDFYIKADSIGVKNFILCGNISEGVYGKNGNNDYSETIFLHDAKNQAEYIVKNYPNGEGINTYFVTGNKDQTHIRSEKIDIGKLIDDGRGDLHYLGKNICRVNFVNSKGNKIFDILVMHPKDKKAYTISYKPQQFISALNTSDKPDILLNGKYMQTQHLNLRKIEEFSVPGMVATTPEMINSGTQHSNGAWCLKINFNPKQQGVKSIDKSFIPYHNVIKDDYRVPSMIKLDKEKKAKYSSIFKSLTNGEDVKELSERIEVKTSDLINVIEAMKYSGYNVDLYYDNDILKVRKKIISRNKSNIKEGMDELEEIKLCVVSDTHLGSVHQQLTLLNKIYREAHKRGINTVLHCGDLVEGDYRRVRESHPYYIFLPGYSNQRRYVEDYYPKVRGLTTYFICGSHDETHFLNGGAKLGEDVASARKDMIYLGQDIGNFKAGVNENVNIRLFHPGGGSAKALSYNLQEMINKYDSSEKLFREGLFNKRTIKTMYTALENPINEFTLSEKPDVLLTGHYHKNYYMYYRDVHALLVPAFMKKSGFMIKNSLINTVGGIFLTLYVNKRGIVEYIKPEEVIFTPNDYIEKDYETCKKLILR